MHAVAVTRSPRSAPSESYRGGAPALAPDREAQARSLAQLFGRELYEQRMRIAGPLPWLVSSEPDDARALARVSALRALGFGAVSCASEDAVPWTAPNGAVHLELGPEELVLAPSGARLRYDAIRVVVLATLDQETSREQIELVRVSSRRGRGPGPDTMPVSRYQQERARTRAAYLFLGPRQRSVRLVQGALGLAEPEGARAPTSFERFERALAALLERTPHAVHDARLVDARRARSGFQLRGDGREKVASNLRETDLVARLVALAWLEGQIDSAP